MLSKRASHLPHLHKSVDEKDFWPVQTCSDFCNCKHAVHNNDNHHFHGWLLHSNMTHKHHLHMPHFHTPHSTQPTKVALAGITGKLGRLIAKHLLSYDFVEVHGIARNPDKLPESLKSNPRLKLYYSNLKDVESLRNAVQGCSILISTVLADPASEVEFQKAMIDACVAEQVPRFMPNEFTLDWRAVDLSLLPMKKPNQEIFDYLEKHKDKISGVHILVGIFMETMFSNSFLFDPSKSPSEGLSAYGNGDDIWELTSYENAAMWATAAALDKSATGFLRFVGDRLSTKEIAQTLQETYQLDPIPFTSKGTLDELKAQVEQGIKEHPDTNDFWAWRGKSYCLFLTNGQAYLQTPLDNGRYVDQLYQTTLEQWLQDKKLEDISKSIQF